MINIMKNIQAILLDKNKISNNANTGLYYFSNVNDFIYYGNYVINDNAKFYLNSLFKQRTIYNKF